MKKTALLALTALMLASCYGSKEAYIGNWADLAERTAANHESYTSRDWQEVNRTFRKLQRKEKHYSLTPSEMIKVKKAQATILIHEGKEEGKSLINEFKGLLDLGTELFKSKKEKPSNPTHDIRIDRSEGTYESR